MAATAHRWASVRGAKIDPRVTPLDLPGDEAAAVACMRTSFCGTTERIPEGMLSWAFGTWDRPNSAPDDRFSPLASPASKDRLDFFTFCMRGTLLQCRGTTLVVRGESGKLLGVAALRPPKPREFDEQMSGQEEQRERDYLRNILGAPPWHAPGAGWAGVQARMRATRALMGQAHPAAVPEPHWYLAVLAVDPAAQGLGVGRALLDALAALADHDRVPAYLECVGARNQAVYARAQYALREKRVVRVEPKFGPPLTQNGGVCLMVRPAAPRSAL